MYPFESLTHDFLRDDAGTPLGHGMPSGAPLRADGQSHYEAWQALLRRDPCSYCGARRESGTVDHVEPRCRSARGIGTVHGWINTVGACARCNGAKRDLTLLAFLHRRRGRSRRGSAMRVPAGRSTRSREENPMAEPVPAGSDASAGTYTCTNCGYALDVGSTKHLPPCPSCGNSRWNTESGGDSVDDPYPERAGT